MRVLHRLAGLGVAFSFACTAASPGPALRSPQVDTAGLGIVPSSVSLRCQERIATALSLATKSIGVESPCFRDLEDARIELARRYPRASFGTVDIQKVTVAGLQMRVSQARRCQKWPLRHPSRPALREIDVRRAGCRVRRFTGVVAVEGHMADGRREPLGTPLEAKEGVLRLDLAAYGRELAEAGAPSLGRFSWLVVGDEGWAGVINLEAFYRMRQAAHRRWVLAGRGAPGLFLARHQEDPWAPTFRALVTEAALMRQAEDFRAVGRGELRPETFLRRYAWSPYRDSVRNWGRPNAKSAQPRRLP